MRFANTVFAAVLFLPLAVPQVRPVPPPGVEVPDNDRAALKEGLAELNEALNPLRGSALYADVAIFERAVRIALENNEFFQPEDIGKARRLLREGLERAKQLAQGEAPWTRSTGLVVRGYVSQIDNTVQPYGLVVPASYSAGAPRDWRLDAWFHGRNERLSEVNFLADRTADPGQFTPRDTIVLHLYGRYCNANKFAGEMDFFEALADVKRRYRIDENRILVRGFSMGGAAAWHIAAHHAGLWAAAAPGAGFSETPEFLRMSDEEKKSHYWWERKLWHLYNATDYAVNFTQLPVVAYNGDEDRQAQAADAMETAMAKEGLRLRRVVGEKTGHRYHPDSKVEIDGILDAIAAKGRDAYPRRIRFTTWTLAYNRMNWVQVDGLERHWRRARVDAELKGGGIELKTSNLTGLTLDFGPGGWPSGLDAKPEIQIDGQKIVAPHGPLSDGSWHLALARSGRQWGVVAQQKGGELRKRHGLQGPVDDAFLSAFMFVRPTGTAAKPAVGKWVKAEMDRAVVEWRRQMRGDAPVKDDSEVTEDDIRNRNLILWGDPSSNRVLAKIADRLPVRWDANGIAVGDRKFGADGHALILVYPNPLNPNRYVVLNSGFTFREFDNLNNARQVPKLPDFAVVDLSVAPDEKFPGKIALGGFFGEGWELLQDLGQDGEE